MPRMEDQMENNMKNEVKPGFIYSLHAGILGPK